MTILQSIILAALQGITELFPVSSLAHAVILPPLLRWPIDQKAPDFLPFLVMLHLGTAAALLIYFWRQWIDILLAVMGRGGAIGANRRLLLLLAVGTVPAVIIGFLLERFLRNLFGAPLLAAVFLIVNGFVLFAAERLRRKAGDGGLARLSWRQAFFIGACQSGALIPGLSRSGLTIGAGLASGLSHAEAARFSFLLATPIIAGAGVLELPKLFHGAGPAGIGLATALLGGFIAALTAYASTAFLMRFFRQHDMQALNPFAYYCLAAGLLSLLVLSGHL
jgi:undecaprenyl-diphosphatase